MWKKFCCQPYEECRDSEHTWQDRLKLPETLKPEQNFFPILVPVHHEYVYPVWALSLLFIIAWFWVSCSYFNTAERAVFLLLIGDYFRKLMNYSTNCFKKCDNLSCSQHGLCIQNVCLVVSHVFCESSGDINLVMRIVFITRIMHKLNMFLI
jgi:hypothetical protein